MSDAGAIGPATAVVVGTSTSAVTAGFDPVWALVVGRPVVAWTVDVFHRFIAETARVGTRPLEHVYVVVDPARLAATTALARAAGWNAGGEWVTFMPGGPRRRDAVRAGLLAAHVRGAEIVVIHDAARPLLTVQLLAAAVAMAERVPAATAIEPLTETLKEVHDGLVTATVPRDRVVLAQTPQAFQLQALLTAHAAYDPTLDPPDDATLALATGLPLATFPGSPTNLKVRTPDDVIVVAARLRGRQAYG